MNAPLRPTLLVLGALSLGGVVVFNNARPAHAGPSTLETINLAVTGKDGGHAIELGGKDGGYSVELSANGGR